MSDIINDLKSYLAAGVAVNKADGNLSKAGKYREFLIAVIALEKRTND